MLRTNHQVNIGISSISETCKRTQSRVNSMKNMVSMSKDHSIFSHNFQAEDYSISLVVVVTENL